VLYREARLEADKANTIRIFLEDTLASVEPSRPGVPVTMPEVLDEAVHWVALALADQPRIEASIRTTIGNSYRALGRYDRAEEQLSRAMSARAGTRADGAERARTLTALALLRLDQDRPADALELLQRALELRRRALGPCDPSIVYTRTSIARALQRVGRAADAEFELIETIALARRIHAPDHPDVALCTFRLAQLEEAQSDADEAIGHDRDALDIQRRSLAPDHPDIDRTLLALGRALLDAGDAPAAEAALRETVTWREAHAPDWRLAEAHAVLGLCLLRLERPREAFDLLTPAIETISAALDDADPRRTDAIAGALEAAETLNLDDEADRYRDMLDAYR
jgi:tetratricopeptide (TPR) repeat protein